MKKQVYYIITSLLLAFPFALSAKNSTIPLTELNGEIKYAEPGDTLYIISGHYKDINLELKASGTKEKPIIIIAKTPGEVVVTGYSNMKIAGEWIEVHGFWFRNGTPPQGSSVIEFRIKDQAANNCRISNCIIESFNPSGRDTGYSYILLYGRNNRVDHNSLLNKLNIGVTLIVMLDQERDQQNFHSIDHNYFGPRPVFGSNGAETIRVGTATQALKSSNTVIEHNYFDRCNGEVEIISIKSCDNIIRYNTFIESQGVLALRHGDRNIANNNYFDGNNVRNTGGIRIVNAAHKVYGNVFYRLKGERFFSALAVMNAVPNSLPNRYCLVENVDINNNIFVDCDHIQFGVGSDQERTLPPEDVRFFDNIIVNKKINSPFEAKSSVSGFVFKNNKINLAKSSKLPEGFVQDNGLSEQRPPENGSVKREDCGQSWKVIEEETHKKSQNRVIYIKPGQDKILEAIASANSGDTLELTEAGDYAVSSDIFIDFPVTLRAAKNLKSKPVVRYNGEHRGNTVTIRNGGELTVKGIAFNGMSQPGKSAPQSGISTMDGMIKPYLLVVDNCEFFDYPETTTVPVRGLKNTFSEKVIIKNSLFRAISADAINFAGERDDVGKYNVDELIVENCSFNRILGTGINLYRGGSDESTAGPIVSILNCTFEDVCNKERGSVLRLIGAQVLDISGCNFSNSGRSGVSVRLDETTFEKVSIINCNFWNSGRVLSMTGNAVKGKMLNIKPEYVDAANFDYRSVKTNKLYIKNIGVK